MFSKIKIIVMVLLFSCVTISCVSKHKTVNSKVSKVTPTVVLKNGIDESAGGVFTYIITTVNATYYLEKKGGGLSSMVDSEGVDWLGFNNTKGSGHKGEYRGFPNAIHKQDGNYFHALNAGTNLSTSEVNIESEKHVRITFTSGNKKWQGQWDFYPERLDFTMSKVSAGYKYWIQYEGVPYGKMDNTDFWFSASDNKAHAINEAYLADLPGIEWIAFGDVKSPRMLYMLHHQDDEYPDNYVSRPDMTVFGFGRSNKDKFLDTPQRFSLGFIESSEYEHVKATVEKIIP